LLEIDAEIDSGTEPLAVASGSRVQLALTGKNRLTASLRTLSYEPACYRKRFCTFEPADSPSDKSPVYTASASRTTMPIPSLEIVSVLNLRSFQQAKLFQRPAKHRFGGHKDDHDTQQHIHDVFRNVQGKRVHKDSAAQQNGEQNRRQKNPHRMIASQQRHGDP